MSTLPTSVVNGNRPLALEYLPPASLRGYARNARTHTRKQVRQIADSIREFGFTNPILADEAVEIIAGHGRLEAAKLLHLDTVPVIRLTGLTDAQKRALRLADNKIALNAGWDPEILTAEIEFLTSIDFDLDLTAFEAGEIDVLLDGQDGPSKGDTTPETNPEIPGVTRSGDIWLLERHRLICGDATSADDFARLMAGETARMVFTDPPYNVPIDGHVCGQGAIKHREFVMASGEMSEAEFIAFLVTILSLLRTHSVDGAIHFICMDWRHSFELQTAARAVGLELKNICVWNKSNAGLGSMYRNKHELVFVFKSGTAPHVNNFELGQWGRHRSNVWDYAGVNSLKADRMAELRMHPTVKPVALVADATKDCSKRGDIVLDPFAGSGTTIIATEQTGRRAFAMEIDPLYVDTAVRRWQAFSGEDAVHAETGRTFAETAAERGINLPEEA